MDILEDWLIFKEYPATAMINICTDIDITFKFRIYFYGTSYFR